MYTAANIRPQPGWLLCRMLEPTAQTESGLQMVRATGMEDGKTTEAVAEVLRVTPPRDFKGEFPISVGDKILLRDFLKAVNAVGDLMGEDRSDRTCLINFKDVMAVVSGPGTLGFYGEFVLEE